jgi:hypothetical protein
MERHVDPPYQRLIIPRAHPEIQGGDLGVILKGQSVDAS